MAKAGIDTTAYKAHSRRAAVTSVTKGEQVLIDTILSTAGWRSESTFARFYDKPIQDTAKNSGCELWLFQPERYYAIFCSIAFMFIQLPHT